MTGLAHTYPTSGEVQAIDRAQRDVQRLEKRAVEYAREPDTVAGINEELRHARARLERLVAPWRPT
ncbi:MULTISPECIES: hypothetical protein [Xanthomonas]|uniref:Uncharacterized protein n=2 Tax=Xanthomonas TaxID=338 RepID=A0A7Z7NHB5_XANCH|nr:MULTISPECIES: hypothetical protein [Xanthomonas]ATS39463.1 hypothetical protein XcfCFBP6988P_16135 [Xanthomonas citri pv. phaseoli var. fuscans]ATS41730.1 hypothetical protein XcfCFBP6989P_04360 [Xanthomonas citri pv. phaseoli var. fuscans]ATS47466.1 hypothetical protein XcfCFBP6990P_13005 [Xanthomonas citri pv. phaseoli var. fuscans]ATS86155.1 hypothetical protein XcfCFBP6991P_21230 [Xanthomonas citri pv. phaseoli var. fuscans]QWN21099.1 hypothetical protein DGM98_14055 [Xanthomonas citri]